MGDCKRTDVIIELEKKVNETKAYHAQQTARFDEIVSSIQKLTTEKENLFFQLNNLVGSYNAYNDSLALIKSLEPTPVKTAKGK